MCLAKQCGSAIRILPGRLDQLVEAPGIELEGVRRERVTGGVEQEEPGAQVQQHFSKATGTAQQKLSQATKLANCLSQAGIDTSKIQACRANFGH